MTVERSNTCFFGIMNGKNKVRRAHREWVDDIVFVAEPLFSRQIGVERQIVEEASDSNGC